MVCTGHDWGWQRCQQFKVASSAGKGKDMGEGTVAAAMPDGIRREFFLCLLWRRIHATDNVSIFIGHDF